MEAYAGEAAYHKALQEMENIRQKLSPHDDPKRCIRSILQSMLFGKRNPNNTEGNRRYCHCLVVLLLRAFPSSARVYDMGEDKNYPFTLLVKQSADLTVLKEVYHLYPNAIKTFLHNRKLPLQYAIESNLPDETIIWIAQKYPEALRNYTASSGIRSVMALHFVLAEKRQHISLALVKRFAELCPDALADASYLGMGPLALAMQNGCHKDVIDYLVSKFPDWISEISLGVQENRDLDTMPQVAEVYGIPLEHAVAFEKILPQLKKLSFGYRKNWECPGMEYFFRYMEGNQSVQDLTLSFPTNSVANVESLDSCQAFQHMIANNTSLSQLTLTDDKKPNEEPTVENSYLTQVLNALEQGLCQNTTIQTLKFLSCHLCSETFLCRLLCSDAATKGIIMSQVRMVGPWTNAGVDPVLPSKLETLALTLCTMEFDFLMGLLRYITNDQPIRHLMLQHIQFQEENDTVDNPLLVQTLANLIRNGNLLTFAIEGKWIEKFQDWTPIMDAMKVNTTIEELGLIPSTASNNLLEASLPYLVKDHNSTLKSVSVFGGRHEPDSNRLDMLSYYLLLNQYGRGKVQAPATTRATLVGLLAEVENEDNIGVNRVALENENTRFNVTYGLLRESPSLWTNL